MSKGRILLVEDDHALVELLTFHLRREEFAVEATADGEDAMLMARESPPDLVILDWMIEGVSGIEVCRRLRRLPETANVPIIMLTARTEGPTWCAASRRRRLLCHQPFSPRSCGPVRRCCADAAALASRSSVRRYRVDVVTSPAPRRPAVTTAARVPGSGNYRNPAGFSRERLLDAVGPRSEIE